MPPIEPDQTWFMHPTARQRLKERAKSLRAEIERLEGNEPAIPRIILPCGCKIEPYDWHGFIVTYCPRHNNFVYSPHYDGTDVFYFVDEENRP